MEEIKSNDEFLEKNYDERFLSDEKLLAEEIEPNLHGFVESCFAHPAKRHVKIISIIIGGILFIGIVMFIAFCRSRAEEPRGEITETVV